MTYRLGFLAASGLVVVGVTYAGVVGAGIAESGVNDPIVDPILAVMEGLTLIAALLIVILMAAVYGFASEERKPLGLIAFSFGVVMAGLTSAVHFVALTAGRQTGFAALEWPSALYAVELLSWDVFLGLSLLFAAPVFAGPGLRSVARWTIAVTGALCVIGAIGPVAGNMALQRVGILGYGVGLPIASLIMALVFRREARESHRTGTTGNWIESGGRFGSFSSISCMDSLRLAETLSRPSSNSQPERPQR